MWLRIWSVRDADERKHQHSVDPICFLGHNLWRKRSTTAGRWPFFNCPWSQPFGSWTSRAGRSGFPQSCGKVSSRAVGIMPAPFSIIICSWRDVPSLERGDSNDFFPKKKKRKLTIRVPRCGSTWALRPIGMGNMKTASKRTERLVPRLLCVLSTTFGL